MITLHAFGTPNGRKITVALEEMELPYKVQVINITKDEQFAPAFLAISPNNRIPAITDDEGPDGLPISVFESGAILLYLAEKTGRFGGTNPREKIAVWEWLMWQMGGFGPMPGQMHHFLMQPDGPAKDYGVARYGKETRRLYGVLDKRLKGRDWVATDGEPSIADFAILGWAWRHERHLVDFADFPEVARWYAALTARPGVAKGLDIPLS